MSERIWTSAYCMKAEELPPEKWVILVTDDKAQHMAYYDRQYRKWIANSNFGGDPMVWTLQPELPERFY